MIYRHCPQCFKAWESKAEFIGHMVEEYQHRYSKAAAMRAWKAADAKAKEEEQAESIKALGMLLCTGCGAAITQAQVSGTEQVRSKYQEAKVWCGACYFQVEDIGWVVREYDGWSYGYQVDRFTASSGFASKEEAARRLRTHRAQMLMQPGDWMAGYSLLQNDTDRREYLGYAAWHMTYQALGYRPDSLSDPRYGAFDQAEKNTYRNLVLQHGCAA